ncbi:glycosyltransferase family 2 protein [Microvirga sp. G4-2]|uniref:glycosyltransferase family 2 protein n=1 Tax=Microvirga sp. G4-2 TaxID=3434467 RepID=UPI0040443FFD
MSSGSTAAQSEFRSLTRDYPHVLVQMLMGTTYAYGLFLTLTLPWSLQETILLTYDWGWFAFIGNLILGALCFLTMLRWCLVHGIAFHTFNKEAQTKPVKASVQPFVSILVPACNEAETMAAAIQSLIALDYPSFEVIVVDDGSKDETYALAKALEGDYDRCSVRVYTKPNGGKWSALNFGYQRSRGELILCVDADSRLRHDTLWIAVARIQRDPGIVAVAGQVTIRNRFNLLTRLQALEYVLGNGGMRMCLSAFGTVTIVPGAIGLYRRSIMEKVAALPCNNRPVDSHGDERGKVYGPLSGETFAEDFQLSLSALALGGRVVYEPRAVAFTKGPSRPDTLISQRYRWMRGTFQVIRAYRRELKELARVNNPRTNFVVKAAYSLDILLIPIVNFAFWAFVATAGAVGVDLSGILTWLLGVGLLNLMTAIIYILVQEDDLALLPFSLLMDLYLSIVVNSGWAIAGIDEARGTRMKWH